MRRWSGAVSPLETGPEEGFAETLHPHGQRRVSLRAPRTPSQPLHGLRKSCLQSDGDLGDGLTVLDEDLSNAWWYYRGRARPWGNSISVGTSYWGTNWAEKVRTKRALLPFWPGLESSGGADAPRLSPASKSLSSGQCRRRCKAGLILVQIRCARPYSDNSPFLKASSGDCGKYVALIDC